MGSNKNCPNLKFGIDDSGNIKWIHQLDLNKDVGSNCGLHCAECGDTLIAVRENINVPGMTRFHYFRHKSGSTCACNGETAIHKAAKSVIKELEGKRFRLPAMSTIDAAPHVSRYRENGRHQRITVALPSSKICLLSFPPDRFIKGSSKVVNVDEVRIEEECRGIAPDGCQPDAMLRMGSIWVALEIRVSHKKEQEDVSKFADAGIGVIEIFLKGITESEDLHSAIYRRISGLSLEGQDRFFGREWLYSPSMRIDLLENWHLCRDMQSPGLESIVTQNTVNTPITVFAANCGRLGISPGKPTADWQAITNADETVRKMKAEYDEELVKEARLKEPPRNPLNNSSTVLEQRKSAKIDTEPGKSTAHSSLYAKEPKKPGFFDKALSRLRKALHRG